MKTRTHMISFSCGANGWGCSNYIQILIPCLRQSHESLWAAMFFSPPWPSGRQIKMTNNCNFSAEGRLMPVFGKTLWSEKGGGQRWGWGGLIGGADKGGEREGGSIHLLL